MNKYFIIKISENALYTSFANESHEDFATTTIDERHCEYATDIYFDNHHGKLNFIHNLDLKNLKIFNKIYIKIPFFPKIENKPILEISADLRSNERKSVTNKTDILIYSLADTHIHLDAHQNVGNKKIILDAIKILALIRIKNLFGS